jgi:hypothetical protein
VIFNEFARESAKPKWLLPYPMTMALKAQAQCRATLSTLVSLAEKKSRNSDEQTIGNGNPPA